MELAISLITKTFIYAIFILSLNSFIVGKTGYWAVGHLAFFAVGALFYGLGTVVFGFSSFSIYLVIMICIIIASFLSLIPALASMRVRGDFFIFVSIALNEVVRVLVEIVAGPGGFSSVQRPPGLKSDIMVMFVSIIIFLFVSIMLILFRRHLLEDIFTMIRTSETASLVLAIPVQKLKTILMAIGGAVASVSGCLFAIYTGSTDPQRFSLSEAVILFALTILGGIDSIRGAIVSSIFYVLAIFLIESLIRGPLGIYAAHFTSLVFGIILIISINFMPSGIMGKRYE